MLLAGHCLKQVDLWLCSALSHYTDQDEQLLGALAELAEDCIDRVAGLSAAEVSAFAMHVVGA